MVCVTADSLRNTLEETGSAFATPVGLLVCVHPASLIFTRCRGTIEVAFIWGGGNCLARWLPFFTRSLIFQLDGRQAWSWAAM